MSSSGWNRRVMFRLVHINNISICLALILILVLVHSNIYISNIKNYHLKPFTPAATAPNMGRKSPKGSVPSRDYYDNYIKEKSTGIKEIYSTLVI